MSATIDRTALQGTIDPDGNVVFQATPRQLSFDVGMRTEPDFGSVKIKGDLPIARDLPYGMEVRVQIVSLGGEVLTVANGRLKLPAFKENEDRFGDVTFERIHTVEIGG